MQHTEKCNIVRNANAKAFTHTSKMKSYVKQKKHLLFQKAKKAVNVNVKVNVNVNVSVKVNDNDITGCLPHSRASKKKPHGKIHAAVS